MQFSSCLKSVPFLDVWICTCTNISILNKTKSHLGDLVRSWCQILPLGESGSGLSSRSKRTGLLPLGWQREPPSRDRAPCFPPAGSAGIQSGKGCRLRGGGLRDLNCPEIHRRFWGDKLWSWHWIFLWSFVCVCVCVWRGAERDELCFPF